MLVTACTSRTFNDARVKTSFFIIEEAKENKNNKHFILSLDLG